MDHILNILHQDSCRYPIAGSLGLRIFRLNSEEAGFQPVLQLFIQRLSHWGLDDLTDHQMAYAIKLAGWEGELLYEEMHKLFSLCEEIHALKQLGLPYSTELNSQFMSSVRKRFREEPGKSRMVAEDKREDWNAGLWWMRVENDKDSA